MIESALVVSEAESVFAGVDAEALMRSLPQKQREVLELVKIQGLSVREASLRTGYSPSDIKVTVHRAIRSLQGALAHPLEHPKEDEDDKP